MHLTFLLSNPISVTSSEFGELGRQLLGGFVAAVIVAVVFTLIRYRIQQKRPAKEFISIKPKSE